MKIVKISLFKNNKPFRLGFHSAQTLRTSPDSIIVWLEFENGISGYGESIPRTYVTGESCSTVVVVIRDLFSPILLSNEINTIDDVEIILNELENECLKSNTLQYNSALGGIDIALLDALGKFQKCSVGSFLGDVENKDVPYSLSIPFLPPQRIEELFNQLQKHKFEYIKVLLGKVERENIERVSLARSLFGDHVDIRVDVNGKWTFDQAISNLENLKNFGLTAVEQPLAKDNIDGLQKLKKAIGIPLIVDESMCSLSDARNLVEREACDILNIKISKCGGLLRSRQIADFAQSQNMLCQLGAHVGESQILSEAGKFFALTKSNITHFEGCSFLLFENLSGKNQFQVKSINEDEFSNSGLGIGEENLQLIKRHCSPIVELGSKPQSI